MARTTAVYVLFADEDAITCPRCRVAVPVGQCCTCPNHTYGPRVEHPLTRLVKEGKHNE